MRTRKAMELPISMIVMLILSVIVFMFGISMVYKFLQAKDISAEIDQRVQEEIVATLREGNELAAIPQNFAKTKIGEKTTFGIGIRNIQDTGEFIVVVGFDAGYTPDDIKILDTDTTQIEDNWLGNFKHQGGIKIEKDKFRIIPIAIRTGTQINPNKQTQKGTYVFNVCVFKDTTPAPCIMGNMASTYNKKIQQINLQV